MEEKKTEEIEEEINLNKINDINQKNFLQEENNDIYINKGILLIFNKISIEYNFNIKGRDILKEKKEESKQEEVKKEEQIVNKEYLELLEKELENTTFKDLLQSKEQNNIIDSIIKDYYIYFITRNESLQRETKDLENLCKLSEMICDFQFEFNKNKDLTQKDLLSLIIWTNDYYFELNEILYCVEYFKLENIFKKNIFKEILNKKKNKIDIEENDKKNLIGLKKGLEIILEVFNNKCIDDPESIKKIIEIIPTLYNIEQKYNLNSKEIYFLKEIKYIYELIKKLNIENDDRLIGQILRQQLMPLRYLYKEKSERENAYTNLKLSLYDHINKNKDKDKNKNDKYRYIIKIFVQEYKKGYKDNKILDELMKIMDDNLLKVSQLLFHEILSQYFDGNELIFDKITNYNTDDYFLKLIASLSTNKNNKILEQILLEVFESKFNAHFMSYTNEINNTIKYEDLTNEQAEELLKGKNLDNLKKCIQLLEDKNIRESNQRFLPNIVYCAYIKSYFYQFISYVFKKANQPIDLKDIISALTEGNDEEFKTNERKVMEIYSFRILLDYLKKNFNDFKNYNFEEKGLTYKKSFKGNDTFDEDKIPQIIEFCGRTIEDFINIKEETPVEFEEEQNFYTNSFLSIKIVSSAINNYGISINSNQYKQIWDYFSKYLFRKEVHIFVNKNDIYLNYFLIDILIKGLQNELSNNSFGLGSFQDNQNLNNLNNRTLGIIIYIIRFCLHSYTIKDKENEEKYFYSKLIDYNSDEDIKDFISNCYIPGRLNQNTGIQRIDLNSFIMNNDENNNNIINEEPKVELISILMMRFLFYSHLFFRNLLGKMDNNTFSNYYSVTDGYTCLRMLISIWDKLNSNDIIPGSETNKVEIFLNRVNKEIVKQYILCKDFTNKENVKKFEESFNKYIINCRDEYEHFKLIYVDKTMKAIIQENNFPLSYEKDDFPFMKYFVLTNNPNIEDLKEKIKDKVEEKKLFLTDNIINYDERLKDEKYENFIKNNEFNKLYLFLSNFYSLSPRIYKNNDIKLSKQSKDIIEKYHKKLINLDEKKIKELNTTINSFTNNIIDSSMKFFGKYINKLKTKNYYIYKNIRRPMFPQTCINSESIIFDLNKISKYKSYPDLLSKYIYKDLFMDEKDKKTKFVTEELIIDYSKYKFFEIDLEEFEDELTSIILPNKRLFYDNDFNKSIIYSFDTFRGKNNNLLNNYIIKYKNCFEEINLEQKQKIKNIINEQNKDIINIYLEEIFIKLSYFLKIKNLENKKYEELDYFNKMIVDQINNTKNNMIKNISENINEEIFKKIRFELVLNIYFNLLKIINYNIDNIIPGDISIKDIIFNLPDMYNISDYTKYFFNKSQEYKLKHLYSIFEEFEKYLFPFILLHVYNKYKTEIFEENKENIINYFELNKDNLNETKFNKRQLIDALRKFISRYLTSSDINNEFNNNNEDGEDIPTHIPLISYLNRNDLWPLNIFYNKDNIEKGFNNLKEYNFLIKHSVDLYKCLSGISFDNNGNIKKLEQKIIKIDESESEFNFYKDISYFNNKNEIINLLPINCLFNNPNDFNNYIKFYNFGNIYFEYINPNNSCEDIKLLAFSNSNNGLYCSKWKLNIENIKDNFFEKENEENSLVFDNNKIADIQNLTCFKILKKNEVYCFGTNNAKFKIIRLKDNYTNIELIQELSLKEDSVCVNNIVEYNNNKTIIISDEKHILVFEKEGDENNYNNYVEKKDINTGNKTYIIKIDDHTLAAFIYPNIIKFYTVDNYEFNETVIENINSDINLSNQKQFKMIELIGENNNILCVCSNEHSIHLIDTNEKKLIKTCVFEGYENNFLSIVKFNGDYAFLMDSNNNLLLTQLSKKEEKVDDLKLVSLIKKLNKDSNLLCFIPYGINHFYLNENNLESKSNELN